MLIKKEINTTKGKCIFDRISRFLFRPEKQESSPYPHTLLFLTRKSNFDEDFQSILSDYIQQYRWLRCNLIVQELPEQIACEGIGYYLYYEGRQLKLQACLLPQVEHVERKTISFRKTDTSIHLIDDDFLYNLLENSYKCNLKNPKLQRYTFFPEWNTPVFESPAGTKKSEL